MIFQKECLGFTAHHLVFPIAYSSLIVLLVLGQREDSVLRQGEADALWLLSYYLPAPYIWSYPLQTPYSFLTKGSSPGILCVWNPFLEGGIG